MLVVTELMAGIVLMIAFFIGNVSMTSSGLSVKQRENLLLVGLCIGLGNPLFLLLLKLIPYSLLYFEVSSGFLFFNLFVITAHQTFLWSILEEHEKDKELNKNSE